MKKNTVEVNLAVGFAAALLLLLFTSAQMYRSLQEYKETINSVEHTHLVLRTLNEMTSTMREIESGQRAFVITDDEQFLKEYEHNRGEILLLSADLIRLTSDNQQQQARCVLLSQLAGERLQLLDKLMAVYRYSGFQAARDFIRKGKSRLKMDDLIKQANIIAEEEQKLLKQRSGQAEKNADSAVTTGKLLTSIAMAGLLLMWWLLRREARKRLAAELTSHENEQIKQIFDLLQQKNVELESARMEAEKANLAKSEFLSSMSHELRSPLNAILGFAQLLESDSPPPTTSQKESIAQILQAGWHLLALINEILDLAKVESRQTPLSNEPVSMIEIMAECRGMIEPQAQQRGIKMIFPSLDAPCFVLADRTRVKQVLINLLSNAIKYNSAQGEVEVKCTESRPGRILVSVTDTGAGLRTDQLEQLFQAFNRLGQEAGHEEGTGIGLVVAKRLIELMGGAIGADSTVGVGSVFWFELAAVDEPSLPAEGCEATANPLLVDSRGLQRHTLLYVEDNPANLKLVQQIIARHPEITLLTALNGNSGIEIARSSLPEVILMDINLPGISGIEAMKRLRSEPETAHIPIIALSANAMPLDIEKGLKAGFFSYITKPIRVNELMAAVNVAMEHAGRKPGKGKL